MKPTSSDALDLWERLAVAEAQHTREHYLSLLDQILTSFGAGDEAASLAEIRAMFAAHEKPGMATLSSEIEAMREQR
jgi:hypothetical protein